jgi:hypothetical protein
MKLFNYLKLFGAFADAYQLIMLDQEPTDRQEKKMLEEANKLIAAGWTRREAFLQRRIGEGEEVDIEAERTAFFPEVIDGKLAIRLQYLQEYMARKMAALQNNTSIHNKDDVKELKEIFDQYGVALTSSFTGLVFDHINWSAKEGQKPKLLVHAKDAAGVEVCIRFEAAGELCQKFMNALLYLDIKPGTLFDLSVEAVDPAIERNRKAGKKVAEPGLYVNHNLLLKAGSATHTGHPPKGQKFLQKPTMEYMETLFKQAQMATEERQKAAA